MSISDLFGIATAHASTTASAAGQHPGEAGLFSPLLIMVLFIAVFYFLIIRPQNRKRKEQAQLINDISLGDEVVTIGGIVGRISKLKDDFIELTIAKDTHITMQKASVANVLPKGTFEE